MREVPLWEDQLKMHLLSQWLHESVVNLVLKMKRLKVDLAVLSLSSGEAAQ